MPYVTQQVLAPTLILLYCMVGGLFWLLGAVARWPEEIGEESQGFRGSGQGQIALIIISGAFVLIGMNK